MDKFNIREVYDFLINCQVLYLTMKHDKQRVLPFGRVNIFEDRLYLRTGLNKDLCEQITIRPQVEIRSVASNGDWIRINATLVEDKRPCAQQSMHDAYSDNPGREYPQVFYLKDVEAIISGSKEDSQRIRF